MRTVLAFGDSLTWGYDPATGLRHAFADRWPNVLGKALGHGARVFSEGLNGRTTVFDDHSVAAERNGAKILPTVLATHQPLDVLIFFLGLNDLKPDTGGGRVLEARMGLERLVEMVLTFPYQRGYGPPKMLIVAPPPFVESADPDLAELFAPMREASEGFAAAFAKVAAEYECAIFDAAEVCECSPRDGVHLDAENNRRLGEALEKPVRRLLDAPAAA